MKYAIALICVVALAAFRPTDCRTQRQSDVHNFCTIVAALHVRTMVAPVSCDATWRCFPSGQSFFSVPLDLTNRTLPLTDSMNIRSKGFVLEQNYPNPFNPGTTIRFSIPEDGIVSIRLYNLLGLELKVLLSEHRRAGAYTISVDGTKLATGNYLYSLELSGRRLVRMMTVLR
jgi:hypothetical protein